MITFKTKQEDCTEHSLVDICRLDNGRSIFGEKICQKCGAVYRWQYDYDVNGYNVTHNPRPY